MSSSQAWRTRGRASRQCWTADARSGPDVTARPRHTWKGIKRGECQSTARPEGGLKRLVDPPEDRQTTVGSGVDLCLAEESSTPGWARGKNALIGILYPVDKGPAHVRHFPSDAMGTCIRPMRGTGELVSIAAEQSETMEARMIRTGILPVALICGVSSSCPTAGGESAWGRRGAGGSSDRGSPKDEPTFCFLRSHQRKRYDARS